MPVRMYIEKYNMYFCAFLIWLKESQRNCFDSCLLLIFWSINSSKVNTGHTVLYGRVGTGTGISLVPVHVLQNLRQNSTKIIRRFSFFVPRSITGLYLPVRYSAKVLHIVHELCENTLAFYFQCTYGTIYTCDVSKKYLPYDC